MATGTVRQPDLSNVAAGQNASGSINTDVSHYGISFECRDNAGVLLTKAEILNDIEHVTMRLDGDAICTQIDPAYLMQRAEYYMKAINGYEAQDGIIHIPFTKAYLDSAEGRSVHALGMADVRNFQVNVKIASGATKVARITPVTESASEPDRKLGRHLRIEKLNRTFSGTGKQEITNLPVAEQGADVHYNLISIKQGAGVVGDVTLKLSTSNVLFDELSAANNALLLKQAGRTPQTGYYHMDFCRFNNLNDRLNNGLLKAFRADVNWTTSPAGAFDIYIEREFNGK